jgi:hypothetical protein
VPAIRQAMGTDVAARRKALDGGLPEDCFFVLI